MSNETEDIIAGRNRLIGYDDVRFIKSALPIIDPEITERRRLLEEEIQQRNR